MNDKTTTNKRTGGGSKNGQAIGRDAASGKSLAPRKGTGNGSMPLQTTQTEPLDMTDHVSAPENAELAYASREAANVHEGIADLYDLGLVDKVTMAEFDASSLTPVVEITAPDIRALRERENVSQGVFAKYFGIAVNTLGQWERGVRRPDGPALKLLSLVDRHGLDYIR